MALLKSGTRVYGNAIIDSNLSIDGTTTSSDYQTGALIVAGGVGIAGNVFINANLNAKDTIISGNLTVTGITTTVNSSTTQLVDPIIDLGGGANGALLTTDDGLARGLALHYYNVGAKEAFIGWDSANTQFAFASNSSNSTGTLLIDTYGNVKADNFLGTFTGVGNLNQLTVNGITRLGNIGNVKITGGTPNYLLQTDGQGNLVWAAPRVTYAAGSNTQVQFNTDDAFDASANFTFDNVSNTLTVDNIVSSTIVQNTSSYDTRVSLSSAAGIIEITSNGSSTQFLPSGAVRLPASGVIYSGTYDGSQLVLLNNDAKLSQLRNGNVKLEVGSGGSVSNTWVFAQNGNTIFPVLGNVNLGNVVTSNYFKGDGGLLSNIVGANVTGQVANATVASTVYSSNQPNITSVGTLTSVDVTGNITSGNANLGNLTTSNYFAGNGSLLTSITGGNVTGQVANSLVAGTVYTNAQPNITSVGNLTNLTVGNATSNVVISDGNVTATGNITVTGNLSAGYLTGNAYYLTGLSGQNSATATYITSNISNVVAGSTITVIADYANATYPGGVFTIAQLGPVTLSATNVWDNGTSTKDAYANYLATSIDTQSVNITLSLSNASFTVQSSDSITIGSSVITGANLIALNIIGNGTYTIPSTYIDDIIQTTTTSMVSLSLTTDRGVYTGTGTTLTANQPVAFALNSLSGSFPNATVPYFSLTQPFNWSASVIGTVSAGNITYSGGVVSSTSLTSVGATSGISGGVDSTYSYTLTTSDYYGAGLYGYGSRTIPNTVTGTVSAATKYYPLFHKITSSASIPILTTSDSYLTHNYVLGDGTLTGGTPSQYLWIAIPGTGNHTFAYTFLGSQVGQDPAVTGSQTIAGYSYKIYGFTNFSVATLLYTVT